MNKNINNDNRVVPNNNPTSFKENNDLITIQLNGNLNDTAKVGTPYTDPGVTVMNKGVDVTSSSQITVTNDKMGSKQNKDTYNFTEAGSYVLKYSVTYNGKTETTTRTVTVSQ